METTNCVKRISVVNLYVTLDLIIANINENGLRYTTDSATIVLTMSLDLLTYIVPYVMLMLKLLYPYSCNTRRV